MKIAQIAPLVEAVPPRLYGGTERIVSYLTEELVRQGHEVTLFASGDSKTSAKLVPCCGQALRLDPAAPDPDATTRAMLEEVRRRAWEFDVLHFHTDRLHLPVFADAPWCMVTTLHGRLDRLDEHGFYRKFRHSPFVSISHAQRRSLTGINWAGTVHHGLPPSGASFGTGAGGGGDYLAFLGRISPEKRPDRAIEIASRADLPLRIAAKVAAEDREYFERVIQPLLGHPRVHFIGEITEAQKADFLGNARAMLFPIDWPEPFGLVMVEAMRCGTPVIAFPHGAVPEVVEDGVTGFLVDSVAEAVAAVERLPALDRREVRRRFEQMFSATRMANDYVSVYQRLLRAAVPQLRPAAREIN